MVSALFLHVGDRSAGGATTVPVVDGRPLTETIAELRERRGEATTDEHDGIDLHVGFFEDPVAHYLGLRGDRQWPRSGHAWVLGCRCGEVGCDPVEVRVTVDERTVTWSDLESGSGGRLEGIGPFTFERAAFEAAVTDAASRARVLDAPRLARRDRQRDLGL